MNDFLSSAFPFVVIGIGIAIFATYYRKNDNSQDTEKNNDLKNKKEDSKNLTCIKYEDLEKIEDFNQDGMTTKDIENFKNRRKEAFEKWDKKNDLDKKAYNYSILCCPIGCFIGVVVSFVLDFSMNYGIMYGMLVGVCVGVAMQMKGKNKNKNK